MTEKNYYLIIDTETANGLDDALVYDIGYAIIDEEGEVYHSESFLIYDIYRGERELMQSCYYANKIPMYEEKYSNNEIKIITFNTAKRKIKKIADEWKIKAIIAHNANFDRTATNTTLRFLTGSKERFFYPYGIPIWCTLTMAKDVIATKPEYIAFCNEKPKQRMTKSGKPRLTAEIIYQFITGDEDFVEEHTGLADVMIEKEIFAYCNRQGKEMKRSPYNERKELPPSTEMQKRIMKAVKQGKVYA